MRLLHSQPIGSITVDGQFTKLLELGIDENDAQAQKLLSQISTLYNTLKDSCAQWCSFIEQQDKLQPFDTASTIVIASKVSLNSQLLREEIKL